MPQPQQETHCTLEPDPELRRRIRDGEPEALAEAVELFYAGTARYALVLMREPAAACEAARDTFLRMVARHPQAAPERPLRAWLFDLCRDACLDLLGLARQHQARGIDLVITRTELHALMADFSQSWEEAVRRDQEGRLLAWLAGQAELRKTVVFLHLFENYSFREVAEITGIPAPSVVTIYYRAMVELKGHLAQSPAGERPEWTAWRAAPPELAGEIGGRARALVGTLALIAGEAVVRDPLTSRSTIAQPGNRFAKDCTLEVHAGHALLRLDDGSDLWVPAGTALDLTNWDAGRREVRLEHGLVLALAARDANKNNPFLLQTPVMRLAAPADAALEVLAGDGQADVAVFYGALECQTDGEQARARRGDGVRVEAGGPPLISQLETFREVQSGTAKLLAASGENPKLRPACRALGKVMRVGKLEKPPKTEIAEAVKKAEKPAPGAAAGTPATPPKRNQNLMLGILLIIWIVVLVAVSLYWQSRGGLHGTIRSNMTPARPGYPAPGAVPNQQVPPGVRRAVPPGGAGYRPGAPGRAPVYPNQGQQPRYTPPQRYTPPRMAPTPRLYNPGTQRYNPQAYNQGYGR